MSLEGIVRNGMVVTDQPLGDAGPLVPISDGDVVAA